MSNEEENKNENAFITQLNTKYKSISVPPGGQTIKPIEIITRRRTIRIFKL